MHRIDGAGHDNHAWVAEDPAANRPPTEITAEWMNAVQEEIANVIEAVEPLNKANNTQLRQAIVAMIAAAVNGGDYKASVRVASTAAINLAAPGANIDGVAMVAGNRFLEKDNATLANRGIYIWNGAAVPATRALDADNGVEFNGGAIIPVEEGAVNADTNWQITNDGVVTIGVTGLTFKVVGASTFGKESAWIPAGAITPRITNGAAYGLIELAANKILVSTLDFDPAIAEYAQFSIRMPKSWNESTVTATFIWSNASGAGDVVWGLQAVAISNDDVLDAAFGAAVTVTDGVTAAGDLMQTAETGAITIAGAPAEGDWVVFQVYRDAANVAADTLAVDARLHGILLNYTTDAVTDA